MNTQENIPEKLSASGKKLPFRIPDSYFDELPGRITERLSEKEETISIFRLIRPQLAMAAMFIGLIAVGYAGFRIVSNSGNKSFMSEEEMVETIEYLAYEMDENMLITALMESNITLEPESTEPETDELIKYLSEDKIDFIKLLNEY
jgi:hypothetical protein